MAADGTGATSESDLGPGWKISPSIKIAAGETVTIPDVPGSGAIQHIWMTPTAAGAARSFGFTGMAKRILRWSADGF